MSIKIPLDAIEERLDHGNLWIGGWGDYESPTGKTCLHGAIRYCQPIPGDAYLIEQVGRRYGFGVSDNDRAFSWDEVRAKVPAEVTDEMLANTFGPQWEAVVALVRRAATLTREDADLLDEAWTTARSAARSAAWSATRDAARDATRDATRSAAQSAAWRATRDAARDATRDATRSAAATVAIRDLTGQHGFTQEHYDVLTEPWATTIGKVHPADPDRIVCSDGGFPMTSEFAPEPVAADLAKATHLSVRINADCAAHLAAMDAKGTPATEVVREAISLHRFGQEGGITRLVVEAADEKARAEAAEAEVERLTAERDALDRANAVLIEARDFQEARAAKAEALVEAGLGLADKWRAQRETYPALVDFRASIAEAAVRLCEQELRAVLGGAK